MINNHLSGVSHLAYVTEKFIKYRAASTPHIESVPEESIVDLTESAPLPEDKSEEPRRESVPTISGSSEKMEYNLVWWFIYKYKKRLHFFNIYKIQWSYVYA